MELPRLPSFLTLVLLLSASVTLAQAQTAHHDHLGQVQFSTSCQQATREDFNRAVALLHSFWFDASAKAFESVAQQDPACAMAYWGVAMTWLGNPFGWPPNPKALQ